MKTDEAEIKAVMRAQRVRGAESRIEKQIAKWTAEGAWNGRIINQISVLNLEEREDL